MSEAAINSALSTLLALTPEQRAQVIAELPESKPTAWQRLQEWATDKKLGPCRHWNWGVFERDGEASVYHVYLTDKNSPLRYGVTVEGEGPTLDDALVAAMEKLP